MFFTQCAKHANPTGIILQTETATPSATPLPGTPDLIVNSVFWNTMWPVPACVTPPYPPLGVFVNIGNIGTAPASNFQILVDSSCTTTVAYLAAGNSINVWVETGYYMYSATAVVDSGNVIAESNESNNSLTGVMAAATMPPTCVATVVPTQTPTPG